MKVRSFQIILAQGTVGSMPWFALSFLTMWLEESCFTNQQAALIVVGLNVGQIAGGFLGGPIVDWASAKNVRHGRVYVAQFSVGIGLPLTFIILYLLPKGHEAWLFGLMLFIFGATVTWCGPVNQCIFSEIVLPKYRSTIYALDRCIEGATACLGSLIVGVLADKVFGFEGDAPAGGHRREVECNLNNANALSNALFFSMNVPWLLCFTAYSFLHMTYGDDRETCAPFINQHGPEAEIEMEQVSSVDSPGGDTGHDVKDDDQQPLSPAFTDSRQLRPGVERSEMA